MTMMQHSERECEVPSLVESPEAVTSVLERIAEPLLAPDLVLSSGRRIEAEARPEGDLVRIRAPGGQVILSVLVTERGPVLRFEAAELDIRTAGKVGIACETFAVRATAEVSIESGGALIETSGGNMTRIAGGRARYEARDIDLVAEPGAVAIHANDDVDVKGERVRLNCEPAPMARTWDEFMSRLGDNA